MIEGPWQSVRNAPIGPNERISSKQNSIAQQKEGIHIRNTYTSKSIPHRIVMGTFFVGRDA